ncbi:MAG: helix-turn-helix domain-containing protein [Clostridia bacterium]|nr:helix-turn-helix domain-containing protein [Clostridia bacterium]
MLEKLNPFVRMAADVSSKNVREYRVVGLDHRLFYVNSGSAVLNIEGTPHALSAGSLVYIPAYSDYEFRFSNSQMLLTVLNFDFTADRSEQTEVITPAPYEAFRAEKLYTGYLPEEFKTHILVSDDPTLGKDMHKIRMLFFNRDLYYRDFASVTLKSLLLKIISRSHTDGAQETALGIISYIKEHYSERLVAKELSVRFGYHPNHINRLLKLNTGMGFKDFVIRYRLKVAKDMLVSTADSITSVSEACGFATPSYFSELFIRYEGMTPREYRNSLRSGV